MKEININIEGYNVNGICVGCLNYDRKMFYCEDAKECFKILANIDVPDGLSIQVCWECLAYVKRAMKFRYQILKAYDILIAYSRENTFLNSPSDFTQHATERLTTYNLYTVQSNKLFPMSSEVDHVKIEIDDLKHEVDKIENSGNSVVSYVKWNEDEFVHEVGVEKLEVEEQVKIEIDDTEILKLQPDIFETENYEVDFQSENHNVTSDDDIVLSTLKEKKKRKSKNDDTNRENKPKETNGTQAKKRRNRSLPSKLVELCSVSEEEMWQVRSEDLNNADFIKMRNRCDDCIKGFSSQKFMEDHMARKHRPKKSHYVQCDVCKSYFKTKDHLSTHRNLHRSIYKCMQCSFRTALKRLMVKHTDTNHSVSKMFDCKICHKEFNTQSKLRYHQNVCSQEKPQCDCCGKIFANKLTLKYHLKILPQNKSDKPKEKLYIPCRGCEKIFHSKKSYRAHVVIHNGLTYPCPTCGKLFQWKRNLARHMRNHRDKDAGALHECRECGKSFSSRDCYNNHMRLSKKHAAVDAFAHECNYCGKKFATKWCMVDHIDWDHLKKIKYQCSVCFKAFKTAKIMVAHVNNIHEGKKNKESEGEHLCEICGKSYKTVKRLKGHVWSMHTMRSTVKNSFKCKLCPATFTWQTSIYKHMKMMHDNQKKNKQSRPQLAKPKQEPYPGIELATRMQYFQQNIPTNLVQNIVQTVQIPAPPLTGILQNIG